MSRVSFLYDNAVPDMFLQRWCVGLADEAEDLERR